MAKQLNVNVAVSADTSQAKAKLEELERNLIKLSANSANLKIGINAADLQKASAAAAELSVHLKQATNADSGTLNFTKLNTSIKASGSTLTEYGNQLLKLGPQGQQAFSQLAQAVATSEVPVKRLSGLFGELGTVLKNTIRWQISSSMIHGFMSSVSQAFNYAQKLNESLNRIQIVTQASTEHMAQFAEQANKAAKQLNTTTTAYTNASLIYYQQGLNDKQVAERTATTIKLANVSGQSAEKVSNQMTAIWNNFDNGTRSLESYADVITALGAATASSSEEIATGLQKFAAVADTVGLSYDHATAALATITATTRQSADTVGTGLRTLFARLQSLSLGEALEDGVNLTKYSKALETIGVKVLDMSGNLRSADDILADMGEKWQTLNDAQKTAVAQTVGGVRQYTTIMALMENFDEYQKNIGIAENSEGTVQRQADIYAKSWEASQKRVKASMESIYSDLIADDFFIGLNDNLSKTLDLLDKFIDAIGGLSTLLPMIAGMMTKAFGPQIASSLVNLGQNIKVLFANPQTQQAERDAFLTSAAQSMAGVYGDPTKLSTTQTNQLNYAQTQLTLQRQYAAAAMSMSKQDQEVAKLHLDAYNNDRNAYMAQAARANISQRQAVDIRSHLVSEANTNQAVKMQQLLQDSRNKKFNIKKYSDEDQALWDQMKKNPQRYGIAGTLTAGSKNTSMDTKIYFDNLGQSFDELGTKIANFDKQKDIIANWADTSKDAVKNLREELIKTGNMSEAEADKITNGLSLESEDDIKELYKNFTEDNEKIIGQEVQDFADQWGFTTQQVDKYRAAIAAAAGDEAKLEQIARQIEQDEKNATNAVKNRSTAMKVAEGITNTASAMMSLTSAASSANSMLNTFWDGMKDGELTTQEIGQGLTSLSSTLMTSVMAFTTLSGVIGPLGAAVVTIASIVIPMLINAFDRLNETDTEKLERLKTEYEEATEYADEAKDAYDRLVSARDSHNELLDELDSLKEGTIEFYNALLQANAAARDLISTYSLQSGSEWYYDQHGAIQFTDVGNRSMEEQAKAQMAQSVYQQEMAGLNFKVADNKNLTPEQQGDFAAHIKEVMTSGTYGYDNNEDVMQAVNALYQENQKAFLSLIQNPSDLSWIQTDEDQELFNSLTSGSYHNVPYLIESLTDIGQAFNNSNQSLSDILNTYETQKWAESNLNLDNIVRTYAQTNGDKYDTLANQIALEMFHEQGHNSSEVAKYYDERYKALEDERDLEGLFQKELGYRASEDLLQDSEKMKSMIARAQTATKYGQDYLKILNDSQVDYLKQYSNYKEMSYSDLKAAIAENQNSDQRHEQIVGQVISDYITEIQNTTDTMLRSMGLQTEQKGYVGSSFETIGYQGLTADELLASGKLSPKELNALSTLYSNIEKSVGEDNELQGIVTRKILGLDENNNFVDNVNKDLLHSLQQVQWGSSTQSIFDLARLAQTAKTTGSNIADTLQTAYETTLKANGGKSKVLETAWDTDEFKKGLKTVQKEFKKTGKISANNIEDIADSCDILSEALENNVLSAGAVADAIELYSIGAIDSIDSISEELIMALETANELEDALQNAFNYIDSFNPDRSTGDIRDTYIKWGKDFYQQLAGGLTGDERTYQIAEFLGNKNVANNLRNFFFEKETGLADKPEARYAAHKAEYDAYDTMWQTVSKEGNFRAWWEFMLGGKGDNLYGKSTYSKDGKTYEKASEALREIGFSMGSNNGDVELNVEKGMTTQDYIDAIEKSTGMSHDAASAFFMELVGSSEGIRGQLQANEFMEGYSALTSEEDKKNFLRSQASELNIEELTKALKLLGYESDKTSQALKDLGTAQEELAEEQEKWAQAFSSEGNKADQQQLVKDLIEDETNGFREGGTLDLTGSKEALINRGNLTDAEANQAQIDYIKDEANGVTELTATYTDATGATREFTASLNELEGTNAEEKLANFNKQLEELSTSTAKANQNLGKDLFAGFLQAIKELTDGSSDWAKEVKKALGFGEGQDFKIDLPITFKTEFEPEATSDKGLLHVIEDIKQMQGNGTITITLKMDEGGDLNKLKEAKDSFNEITEKQPITISFSTEDISEEELAKVKEQIAAIENQPAIITVQLGENTLASDIKTLLDSIPDTKNIQITYTLPDGSTITAGSQGLINSIFNPNDQTLAQSQFDASITRYSEYADIGAYQLTPGSEEYWQAYNANYNGTGYSVGSIANGVPTQIITPDMLGEGQTLSDMYEFNGSGVATLSEAGMTLLAASNAQKDAAQKQVEASESNRQAETSAGSVTRQGNNKVSINGQVYDLNGTQYTSEQITGIVDKIAQASYTFKDSASSSAERDAAEETIRSLTTELGTLLANIQKDLKPEESKKSSEGKSKDIDDKPTETNKDNTIENVKAEVNEVEVSENTPPVEIPNANIENAEISKGESVKIPAEIDPEEDGLLGDGTDIALSVQMNPETDEIDSFVAETPSKTVNLALGANEPGAAVDAIPRSIPISLSVSVSVSASNSFGSSIGFAGGGEVLSSALGNAVGKLAIDEALSNPSMQAFIEETRKHMKDGGEGCHTINGQGTRGTSTKTQATGGMTYHSYVNGSANRYSKPGISLTAEEGPEIVWNKQEGYAYIVGGEGHPEFAMLRPGDRIFNANDTRQILNYNRPKSNATSSVKDPREMSDALFGSHAVGSAYGSYGPQSIYNRGGRGGGGKAGGTKEFKPERYHLITRQIQDLTFWYDELKKARENAYGTNVLDSIDKEIAATDELVKANQELLKEVEKYKEQDLAKIAELGIPVEFDEAGNIANFDELQEQYKKKADEEKDEEAQKAWDALTQYEETLDKWQEVKAELSDMLYDYAELRLERITVKAEMKVDFDDREIKYIQHFIDKIDDNLYKTNDVLKLFGSQIDLITHKISTAKQGIDDIFANMTDRYGNKINITYEQWLKMSDAEREALDINGKYGKQLEQFADDILDYIEALEEYKKKGVEEVSAAFDELNDKVNSQIDLFSHYSTMLSSLRDIADLQGLKLPEGFRQSINKLNQSMIQVTKDSIQSYKNDYIGLQKLANDTQNKINETTDESLKKAYQEDLDKIEAKMRSDVENVLQLWQEGLSKARDIFDQEMQWIQEDYEATFSELYNTADLLQSAFDRKKEINDEYVDDYEKYYQLGKLQRSINKDLDNAAINGNKQNKNLKVLLEEIQKLQKDGTELSAYDLDILAKKYEYEKALADLEDARTAKQTVRLSRDRNGNWGYVYTAADGDELAEQEQAVEDKLYEYTKAATEQSANLQNEILRLWSEAGQKIAEMRAAGVSEDVIDDFIVDTQTKLDFLMSQLEKTGTDLTFALPKWVKLTNESFDLIGDNFTDTILSLVTGMQTITDTGDTVMDAILTIAKATKEAAEAYNDSIGALNFLVQGNSAGFNEAAESWAKAIVETSAKNVENTKLAVNEMVSMYDQILIKAKEFEEEFEKKYAPIIEQNEKFLADLLNALGILNGLPNNSTILTGANNAPTNAPMASQPIDYTTGPYTGVWDPSGKLTFTHDSLDVQSLLHAANILNILDLQTGALEKGLGQLIDPIVKETSQTLEQEVYITAEFPNATNHSEIEEAFNNLANRATQYANRKVG